MLVDNKYHARRIDLDGHEFDSKAEANRFLQLELMQRAGEIRDLELQPRFELIVNKVRIGRYTADFRYFDCRIQQTVVEDVKGVRTRDYILRVKLVKALYGIEVQEVR